MRVSLLDRARTREGETDADALAATVRRAVRAEELGFHRFWTAEHHAVPGIASASPAVLLAAIGALTSRIRLGTAGIMVPNHRPLVIAEQALSLAALYPGRIDIGLGGSLGFTAPVRRALGRTTLRADEYAADIGAIRSYLAGSADITVRPRVEAPPVFLLAIKGGLAAAAEMGLPVIIGGPLLRDTEAIEGYFRHYRPSALAPDPLLLASVEVMVAESAQRARELLLSEAWAYADARDVGEFRALRPVAQVRRMLGAASSAKKVEAVHAWLDGAVAGTPEVVSSSLADIAERTGATEIVASVSTYDHGAVRETDEFLSALGAEHAGFIR